MRRLALPLALLLSACGDDTVGTATDASTSAAASTSTGGEPTTSGSTSTTAASTSSASESASGTTTTGDATTSSGTTSPISGTTTSDDTTSTTGDDTTSSASSTTGDGTTTSDDTTTGGSSTGVDTTGGEVELPPLPGGVCNLGQGPLTTFVDDMPMPPELHIVAMYQATNDAATVTVSRTGVPLTLFLSSYEPVAFTLVLAPGVQLERVILGGYNKHTVQGQGPAVVTDISANFGDPNFVACGYFWPMNDGGCDTPGNVEAAESLTGLPLTTFAGCYEGITFSLD